MNKSKIPAGFLLLCIAWLALMALVGRVDYDWTLFLREHRLPALDRFMDRTLFEGEGFGGGDPVIFLIVAALAAYYWAWKHGASSRFHAWRPHLGFFLTSALTVSVLMTHSLKWVMGRARPSVVLKGHVPFSDWFVFGPHFITEGTYRGSFPSGHTTQAFVVMAVAYVLAASPRQSRAVRLAARCWGGIALGYVALMGISRCMSLNHWLSDVLGAVGLSWMLMHAMHHWILKVPDQTRYFRQHGRYPDGPLVWELRLCLHILGMVLAGMALMLGLRGVMLGDHWLFWVLMPAGVAGIVFFNIRFRRLRRRALTDVFSKGPS